MSCTKDQQLPLQQFQFSDACQEVTMTLLRCGSHRVRTWVNSRLATAGAQAVAACGNSCLRCGPLPKKIEHPAWTLLCATRSICPGTGVLADLWLRLAGADAWIVQGKAGPQTGPWLYLLPRLLLLRG